VLVGRTGREGRDRVLAAGVAHRESRARFSAGVGLPDSALVLGDADAGDAEGDDALGRANRSRADRTLGLGQPSALGANAVFALGEAA